MADLTQIAQQLKFGSTYERVLACQKLVGLDNSVRSGHEVSVGDFLGFSACDSQACRRHEYLVWQLVDHPWPVAGG